MNEKKSKIVLIISIIVILGVVGYFINKKINEKSKEELKNHQMVLYYNSDNDDYCYDKTDERCIGNLEEIIINLKDSVGTNIEKRIVDTYHNIYIAYIDNNKYMVYDNNKKESYELDVPYEDTDSYFQLHIANNKIFGVFKGNMYYSFEYKKSISTNDKYDDLEELSKDYLAGIVTRKIDTCDANEDDDYCTSYIKESVDVIRIKDEKVILTLKPSVYDDSFGYEALSNEKGTYFLKYEGQEVAAIYNEFGKEIYDDYKFNNPSIDADGNLYDSDNGKIYIYNNEGKRIKTIKGYDWTSLSIKGYVVSKKNNKLYLVTDGKEIELMSWDENNDFRYNDTRLVNIRESEKNNNEKIYVIVYDSRVTADEVLEDCQKYKCGVETKEYLENKELGYKFVYDIETGQLDKIRTYCISEY